VQLGVLKSYYEQEKMRFFPKLKHLSKDDLVELARRECKKEGWPWLEPVHIQDRMFRWIILTNALLAGRNVQISVANCILLR